MNAASIAALMIAGMTPPSGSSDTGFHQGVIQSWDELTGLNTVKVNGVVLTNLKTIQGGIGVMYVPDDVVAIFRYQSNYFVWGKIAAPGASAATQIRSNRVAAFVNASPQAFGDLPASFGPELQNVYIGSSRRCLVVHSCEINVSQSELFQAVQVRGASTINVETGITDAFLSFLGGNGLGLQISQSVTASTVVTAANGLNQGFNTFTCKYKIAVAGTGTAAAVNNRVLTVIPF